MNRRAFLSFSLAAAAAARLGRADTPPSTELERHDLVLDGDPRIARRALVLVPKHVSPKSPLPLLVLLHGLGETGNERLGIHAWGERYGLVSCYERLRAPPLARVVPRARYLTDERISELDASLARRPFRGLAIACPVTPNPHKVGPAARTLDAYAEWIEQVLVPAARRVAPIASGPRALGIDGCSLGGYVGMEVFLRKPELFGSFGTVQGAFGEALAVHYADRLAEVVSRVGPRPIHIESSSEDPYRRANEALSRRLSRHGIPHVLRVPPGPHDQPWLREVGTLELLLWHDRVLFA